MYSRIVMFDYGYSETGSERPTEHVKMDPALRSIWSEFGVFLVSSPPQGTFFHSCM